MTTQPTETEPKRFGEMTNLELLANARRNVDGLLDTARRIRQGETDAMIDMGDGTQLDLLDCYEGAIKAALLVARMNIEDGK